MSNFLITGGAGFIGSHIAEHLVRQGHCVRILDNFSSGKIENLEFARRYPDECLELVRGDVTNPSDCVDACEGIDFVLHQAALLSVTQSMKHPLNYNRVNVDGTLFMLQAAARQRVKRFVLASSAAVYGNVNGGAVTEEQLPAPISPYALSKLAGEHYCRIFAGSFDLETVCLRYFNVFGPKQALNDDYSSVIPKFINCLLNDQPTPIYGTGEQSRDFVYINDVVAANVLAATTPGIQHGIFNVASGESITILELVRLLNQCLDKDIKPVFLPNRLGDIFKIDPDISRISRALNYKPRQTFEEGLKQTVEYFQDKREPTCLHDKFSAVA